MFMMPIVTSYRALITFSRPHQSCLPQVVFHLKVSFDIVRTEEHSIPLLCARFAVRQEPEAILRATFCSALLSSPCHLSLPVIACLSNDAVLIGINICHHRTGIISVGRIQLHSYGL
jgi:hypothetical protein